MGYKRILTLQINSPTGICSVEPKCTHSILELKPWSLIMGTWSSRPAISLDWNTSGTSPSHPNGNIAIWTQVLSSLTYSDRQWRDHIHGPFSLPADWVLSAEWKHLNQMGTDEENCCISWKEHPSLTSVVANHPGYAVRNKTYNKGRDRLNKLERVFVCNSKMLEAT